MKLNSEKKVLLTQKALYTKQLVHYRQLCEVYKKLADIDTNGLNGVQRANLKAIQTKRLNFRIDIFFNYKINIIFL